MACYFADNIHTSTFTPKEYQVDLLDAAKHGNTIICFGSRSSKLFVAIKLIQELAIELRRCLGRGGKRTIYLADKCDIEAICVQIKLLTDLRVVKFEPETESDWGGWESCFAAGQVIVMCKATLAEVCARQRLALQAVNLVVIDQCHNALVDPVFRQAYSRSMQACGEAAPRILGLTRKELDETLDLCTLEREFRQIEETLACTVNTSSDIVTVLRYCSKPKEVIVECARPVPCPLADRLRSYVNCAQSYLDDHRYDPYEIYDEEFREELKNVPDPKVEPHQVLSEFLYVLDKLGPWCADRAALALLVRLEKLKIKTPYERHFLLLCMTSTVMVMVRASCEQAFAEMPSVDEAVMHYSAPKVLRLLRVLKQCKPQSTATATPLPEAAEEPAGNVVEAAPVKPERCPRNADGRRYHKGLRRSGPAAARHTPGLRHSTSARPNFSHHDSDEFCAIVFVEMRCVAKILYQLINELSRSSDDYVFIAAQYTVDKVADPSVDFREAELEHKKQEEVLKKFRVHDCNLLVATSVLEEGIDVPKCSLVVRFDLPSTYSSYVQCKGRARASDAQYVSLVEEHELDGFSTRLAQYIEIEKVLLRKCGFLSYSSPCSPSSSSSSSSSSSFSSSSSSPKKENALEDSSYLEESFRPGTGPDAPSVSLDTAIPLVNKYCAKLPSDTFTRLTPLWWIEEDESNYHRCVLRLPINSPLKRPIRGAPRPSKMLACKSAALAACRLLHSVGELDDNLLPIGKENFRAHEEDWNNFSLEEEDELLTRDNAEPRPGTTKRRQYYYKKVANSLTDCRPTPDQPSYLYNISMVLTCPLPEEQNTRGRKIYPPEESPQGFGILTSKQIPKICSFPIFTRSGEVSVSLQLAPTTVRLSDDQMDKIYHFLNYTFTSVLKLQKYLMLFDPHASENSYFIVPTIRDGSSTVRVDWDFLEKIYADRYSQPRMLSSEQRLEFHFEQEQYRDAVVMPWYRNQDQPQYFYVAEICYNLNPKSNFPGTDYSTFEEYYFRKYGIQIQNVSQPLLDVDHTSARLNFLTPRYVNRKGVALPTSSEETKRAKRENLEQKQILVPELCTVHPFSASLWRKAVCLPCILYRINALLLADQIRKQVAEDLSVGLASLEPDLDWPALNFGWSLSDVLSKSRDPGRSAARGSAEAAAKPPADASPGEAEVNHENKTEDGKEECAAEDDAKSASGDGVKPDDEDEEKMEKDGDESAGSWMEIGTWSNDMAGQADLGERVRYGSPTVMNSHAYYDSDSDDSCTSESSCGSGGLRIAFTGANVAEAVEEGEPSGKQRPLALIWRSGEDADRDRAWTSPANNSSTADEMGRFEEAIRRNRELVVSAGMLIRSDRPLDSCPHYSSTHCDLFVVPMHAPALAWAPSNPLSCSSSCSPSCLKYEASNGDAESGDGCLQVANVEVPFSFDHQPDLTRHPGPSPSVILQALTMSNANDGINLERLETIGDSFLKYAITNYLYSTYDNIHEGKLSHLRSKQVSNLNLYRLGRKKVLGETMIATKFDPHDNWLPPCFYVPRELEQALIDAKVPANLWNTADIPMLRNKTKDEISRLVREKSEKLGLLDAEASPGADQEYDGLLDLKSLPCFIPYNLVTQHSIPDKSIADCVEALIGAYLIECGPRGALLFMAWLGIRVLPVEHGVYGRLQQPRSPLLRHVFDPEGELAHLLDGYEAFERSIRYRFADRSYLLQSLTHASYTPNTVTDCYQRLEFLGDAVLDYLITRHLYEDPRMHSPGALTDLRSALVNNTIFASLAVRYGFHKYFRHLSPGLHEVVDRFVRIQDENGHSISEECYLIEEDECEEAEDVEVPKALGDVFESVAGAIFLDSGMSLDAVWRVYHRMMKNEIEQFSMNVPKSPIRELLELEPETAKFSKPEKLADGRRVRVTVEVFGKGSFKGIGRNYRIAKCTAAKCALKQLKKRGLLSRKN